MKTQLFVLSLFVALGCDANLTQSDTSALDQIPSVISSQTVTEDCYNSPKEFSEKDGSPQQNWPNSNWDPTIQHTDFDQDIFVRGLCEIDLGCEYKVESNPDKFVIATGNLGGTTDINVQDKCSGEYVTQYQVNTYSNTDSWDNDDINLHGIGTLNRTYIGRFICSEQRHNVPCTNGCSDGNGVCIPPVTISASNKETNDGFFKATCSPESVQVVTSGVEGTVDCDEDDQVTLLCDVKDDDDRRIDKLRRKNGSSWTTVKDCNDQNTCSHTETLLDLSREYECYLVDSW